MSTDRSRGEAFPGSARNFFKLVYPHHAIWKYGTNFQSASHGFNDLTKRADEHVSASFNFGYGSLLDL